jgi:hypothetical protein
MTDWSPLVKEAVRVALRDGSAFLDSTVLRPHLAKEVAISYLQEIGRRDEIRFRARRGGLLLVRVDVDADAGGPAVVVIDEPRD